MAKQPDKEEVKEIGIVLPMGKIPARNLSPSNMVIFSKPKVGKTSILADLPECLILDLQKGTNFIDAMAIHATSVEDIVEIGKAIRAKETPPYKFIAIDTGTDLEEMCIPYAEKLYMKTPMGSNWLEPKQGKDKYGSILNMPNGSGYPWLREAFTKMLNYIKTWAPRTIISCHVKDILLEKSGNEFTSMDLDLTGKLKRIVCSESDAIGYLYRKGSQNILSFKTSDEISCGARPEHLRNKEVVISELDDKTGKITTHWNQIFID